MVALSPRRRRRRPENDASLSVRVRQPQCAASGPATTLQLYRVDKFLATGVGEASWEVRTDAAEWESIFTTCLLDAFKCPPSSMVADDVEGKKVIPNRRLARYLETERHRVLAANRCAREEVVVPGSLAHCVKVDTTFTVARERE